MTTPLLTCTTCPASAPRPARGLPRGWKTMGDRLRCVTCVTTGYVQRAIVVPLAGPVEGTWAEFGADLRASWGDTTRLANWLVTQLYARDVRREPGDTKLRPMPRHYLYPEARALAPDLPAITIPTLIQQVERTYRRQRYELLWTGARSLASHRYPVPLPLHRTQWRLTRTDGGAIIASVKLRDRWWDVRLRGGADFARQRQYLEQLLSGEAEGAAGAIYRVVAHTGDHRPSIDDGEGVDVRVLLKLVAWVPRVAPRPDAAGVLDVRTSGSDLLVCRVHGRGVVLTISGDQIRRGLAGFAVRQQRLSDTLGVARRFRAREREALEARRSDLSRRSAKATTTWLQQTAAQVAEYARRQGLAQVAYDDSEDSFATSFPWHRLRGAIRHACESRGVGWIDEQADDAREEQA